MMSTNTYQNSGTHNRWINNEDYIDGNITWEMLEQIIIDLFGPYKRDRRNSRQRRRDYGLDNSSNSNNNVNNNSK